MIATRKDSILGSRTEMEWVETLMNLVFGANVMVDGTLDSRGLLFFVTRESFISHMISEARVLALNL